MDRELTLLDYLINGYVSDYLPHVPNGCISVAAYLVIVLLQVLAASLLLERDSLLELLLQ